MQQTSKQFFTILTLIHSALLTAQTAFAAVAYYLISTKQFTPDSELKSVLQIVAIALMMGGFFGSFFIAKNQLSALKSKTNLMEKLNGYRTTLIVKWALLEMPSLFALVSYLMTGSFFFIGLAGAIIVFFFMNRPSANTAYMDLELSPEEKKILDNPDSVIG